MAQKTAIDQLSDEHRRQLNERLISEGFFGYQALADWLNSLGYQISRSSAQRYGKKLERKVQAIEDALLTAKIINEQVGDDKDLLSEATVRFVQSEIFQGLMAVDLPPEEALPLYFKSAKAVSELAKASRDTKKFQQDMARLQAELEEDPNNDKPTLATVFDHIKQVYGL